MRLLQRPGEDAVGRLNYAFDVDTSLTYNLVVYTVIETPSFTRLWPDYWTEDERGEFVAWLALHPEAGDVIKGSGGCRKVRWSRAPAPVSAAVYG